MPTLPDDFDDRLRDLHDHGFSRNEIAKQLGCSVGSVTSHAKKLNLAFDRSHTAAAVQAHQIDMAARRAAIVDRLYRRSETVLSRLEADIYRYTIAIPGQGYEHVDDAAPPAADERALASSIVNYLTAAAKLEAVDADNGETDASSMLEQLGAAIKRIPLPPQ